MNPSTQAPKHPSTTVVKLTVAAGVAQLVRARVS
jgi:hypothetical protein